MAFLLNYFKNVIEKKIEKKVFIILLKLGRPKGSLLLAGPLTVKGPK